MHDIVIKLIIHKLLRIAQIHYQALLRMGVKATALKQHITYRSIF